jgi:hypothetical protein
MAISFELTAHTDASVTHVFDTIADLRSWNEFLGVRLRGPERRITAGDRINATLRVMRLQIQLGCIVRSVDEPSGRQPAHVDIRSIEGPIDARMIGHATPSAAGCDLKVEIYGIGRGPAAILERPVELIMQRWAAHQMRHLLSVAASSRSFGASS